MSLSLSSSSSSSQQQQQQQPQKKQQQSSSPLPNDYRGDEHHLIGLSPQYWCHTLLLVSSFHSLLLSNGVNCLAGCHNNQMRRRKRQRQRQTTTTTTIANNPTTPSMPSPLHPPPSSRPSQPHHLVPISRCEIIGIIVNIERKRRSSSNVTSYLIDDGTGFVDCVNWEDYDGGDGCSGDYYHLPRLETTGCFGSKKKKKNVNRVVRVGDTVRVAGVIHCVYASEDVLHGTTTTMTNVCGGRGGVVRELKVTVMEIIDDDGDDYEAVHWLRCMKLETTLDDDDDADDDDDDSPAGEIIHRRIIPNGPDMLKILGRAADDYSQGQSSSNETPVVESSSSTLLLTTRCRCRAPYKDNLLYCHCHATSEKLDPHFRFRESLLRNLLERERRMQQQPQPHENDHLPPPPLRFHYKNILNDEALSQIALFTVTTTTKTPPSPTTTTTTTPQRSHLVNAKRLLINTFNALRDDGIIALMDDTTDEYLLLSRDRVLEPYARSVNKSSCVNKEKWRLSLPIHLTRVSRERWSVVERGLSSSSST